MNTWFQNNTKVTLLHKISRWTLQIFGTSWYNSAKLTFEIIGKLLLFTFDFGTLCVKPGQRRGLLLYVYSLYSGKILYFRKIFVYVYAYNIPKSITNIMQLIYRCVSLTVRIKVVAEKDNENLKKILSRCFVKILQKKTKKKYQ